ncbi:MAG: PilZ domain-containing protein [Bryobacteraceae bacterium]|jgi:PilZ domain-containing protein
MGLGNKKDIRQGARHPFQGAVQISWQDQAGEKRMIRAKCLDLSDTGICILCEQPMNTRTSVYVQAPAYGLMGNATVRYCRRSGLKHTIGLMFSSATSQAETGRKRCLTMDQADAEKQ